jgi:hypothetical protein
MYVLWMLVVLVGASNTTLVMWGEAAAPDVVFPLYKRRDVLGQAVTTPQGKEAYKGSFFENEVIDFPPYGILWGVQ